MHAARAWTSALARFRAGLGIIGFCVLVAIIRHIGAPVIFGTLRSSAAWVPALCFLELWIIASEMLSSYIAFGELASRIPYAVLFRAHVLGHSIAAVAPAPTVFRETIKATLLTPYVGGAPAASVAFVNQAATLISVGVFSIPCGAAVFALAGKSLWFWACVVHALVLIASGVGLQAATRADILGAFVVRTFPRLGARVAAFREHASGVGLFAAGPTIALLAGRCVQAVQFGLAAHAVGIKTGVLRAMATQGVNLVASAVGVLVPAGIGTTDSAFTLAAGMLQTTLAKAMSLALLMRCTQLVWVLIGALVAFLAHGRIAPRRQRPGEVDSG